jgi:hypothetical protein
MSDREIQDEELKAFEAALGSLRPRADGLDRRWRFLLAQEAAFNQRLPEGEVLAAGRVICTRCGGVLARDRARWAWPTAFSAMTAVAAVLFVALLVRSGPELRVASADRGVAAALPAAAAEDRGGSVASVAGGYRWLQSPISAVGDVPYLDLRDQVLRYGVDSWRSPASTAVATKLTEPTLGCRGQLDLLLKQGVFFHGS